MQDVEPHVLRARKSPKQSSCRFTFIQQYGFPESTKSQQSYWIASYRNTINRDLQATQVNDQESIRNKAKTDRRYQCLIDSRSRDFRSKWLDETMPTRRLCCQQRGYWSRYCYFLFSASISIEFLSGLCLRRGHRLQLREFNNLKKKFLQSTPWIFFGPFTLPS